MALPPTNAHIKNGGKMGHGSDPKGMDTANGESCCEAAVMKSTMGAVMGMMTSSTTPKRAAVTTKIAKARE